MKYLKMLGLAAVAAMALMAVTAGAASATTLEVAGTAQTESVAITASAETSITLSDTENTQANTCSVSSVAGTTSESKTASGEVISAFTGKRVTGPISTLSFETCTRSPVTVDTKGALFIEWESGTSGSVFSEGASVTVPTTFGFSVTCTTASEAGGGTKIGTLTGSASEKATMSIAAVLSCGFLLPSASWKGSYLVTSPEKLGVVS
ncbi:MAG TPA: hypothetical protein VEP91_01470 [Solirubrobacterales bacterium]|nr:hypothetical protein [Solirubrobacterales bacterium]